MCLFYGGRHLYFGELYWMSTVSYTHLGQLIHTNALIEGLKPKKVGYAGLDVYEEEEPYFYEDKSCLLYTSRCV